MAPRALAVVDTAVPVRLAESLAIVPVGQAGPAEFRRIAADRLVRLIDVDLHAAPTLQGLLHDRRARDLHARRSCRIGRPPDLGNRTFPRIDPAVNQDPLLVEPVAGG